MKCYGNGCLTLVEACCLTSDTIRGRVVCTPKPPRSLVFAYHLHQLALSFRNTRGESPFCQAADALFCAVVKGTRLLEDVPHRTRKLVPFLLRLCRFHEHWCRQPETWLIHRNDIREGEYWLDPNIPLRSLIRHLFVRYEMPEFWDSVWFQEGEIDYAQMEWFVHVARGRNLRKAKGLPLVLTKQAAHEMGSVPQGVSVLEAMRWAQLRALGADRELCQQVLRTPAATDFVNDAALWMPLFRVMIRDPDYRPQVTPAMVDYVCLQRFGLPNGDGYQMLRKNLRSLRREMATFYRANPDLVWQERHRAAPRVRPQSRDGRVYNWPRMSGVRDWDETDRYAVRWRLFELRRSYQLETEGRRLAHCVGTYVAACRHGDSSIWSLRSLRNGVQHWEATIELDRRTRTIVQVKGCRNSRPSSEASDQINQWATGNHLRR